MNKQAFDRGFFKAALENGVEPLLAARLLKSAGFFDRIRSSTKDVSSYLENTVHQMAQDPALQSQFDGLKAKGTINTLTDAGLGGLGGAALGGTVGYLGGRDKEHPENDHSTRDAILMGLLGGGMGAGAGGMHGANQSMNELARFSGTHPLQDFK